MKEQVKHLFSYQPYWAQCFGTAPFLPTSQQEMQELGWDSCDIIIVTGDAYIDHPSFGMALIGRLLEAQGFRVGIISQPQWNSTRDFTALGKPNLFFGITAGNMDSLVNHYTSERRIRRDDAYTPGGEAGMRPDRAVTVYAQRSREAYSGVPIIIGSIEASLRRLAHYDYWSDKVRRSVLLDSKADMLIYGNAERAIVELAHRLAAGAIIGDIRDIRGTAFSQRYDQISSDWQIIDVSQGDFAAPVNNSPATKIDISALGKKTRQQQLREQRHKQLIRLPAYETVREDKLAYAYTSRHFHLETNPGNARILLQQHGDRDVWVNPPPHPLSTEELDAVYDFSYARRPHPRYAGKNIPAWEMIRNSVNIMRGCFGGCTFCSITEHEGRIIQSRSTRSILREIEAIRDQGEGFTGVISDLGGPTANMWRLRCKDPEIESSCRRLSCVYPEICPNLDTDQTPLVDLYRQARELPGIKKVLIGSGVRYDLAIKTPEYVKELTTHHVGGYLKIAPEHTEEETLNKMMKPGIDSYYQFKQLFNKYSKEAGKEQFLIPYFIAAHPGSSDKDMLNLALWLKKNNFRPDQVQTFLPSPMAMATTMYHSGYNPLRRIDRAKAATNQSIFSAKAGKQRRLQKAFLRYHDPENWPLLRETLRQMGRADLIGNSKNHLVPAFRAIPILRLNQGKQDTTTNTNSHRPMPNLRKVTKNQRGGVKRDN